MMITESESVRRMNQLNISPPIRKFSDGALLTFAKNDGIYTSSSPTNAYPSGGCLLWPNGEINDAQLAPSAALDLASTPGSKSDVFSQRKQREFTPDFKKNTEYWDRRRRNNEAAKRSREKRRMNDMFLENRVVKLMRDNAFLKLQLAKICDTYNLNLKEILAEANQGAENDSSEVHFELSNLQDPLAMPTLHQSSTLQMDHESRIETNYLGLEQSEMKTIEQLRVPMTPSDIRRRHSCGSRPHMNQENVTPPPKINIQRSDAEQVVDGILTPPKEESSNNLNSFCSLSPSLPHKLRHKPHLSDKDSPSLPLPNLLPVQRDQSGDELHPPKFALWHAPSDAKALAAAATDKPAPKTDFDDDYRNNCRVSTFELKHENDQLRSELHQLASEVANLRDVLLNDSGRKRKKSVINCKPTPSELSAAETSVYE